MSSTVEESPGEKPQENVANDTRQNSPPNEALGSEKKIIEPFGKAHAVLISTMIVLTLLVQVCTYFTPPENSFSHMHWHVK
jgi:hypothetical protein